jgi:adenylate cyclase
MASTPRVPRHPLAVTVALGLASSLVVLGLVATGVMAPVEEVAVDLLVRLRGERPVDPRIVVVDIDSASVDRLGRWPWPRTVLADLTDRLAAAGARVVAFDVVLSEPSRSPHEAEDAELARSIGNADNVLLSFFLLPEERSATADSAFRVDPNIVQGSALLSAGPTEQLGALASYEGVEPSLPLFVAAARGQGFTTNERQRGISRHYRLVAERRDFVYPSLPLAAVAAYTGTFAEVTVGSRGLPVVLLGGEAVTLDPHGRLWVSYAGKGRPFPTVSVADLVTADVGDSLAPELAATLDDALVFVGASETGIGDFTATPFASELPGVDVHATVADNLLRASYLVDSGAPVLWSLVALLLLGPLVAFLVAVFDRNLTGSLWAAALLALWPVVSYLALVGPGWHLQVVPPVAAGTLALLAALRYQVGTVDARSRQIRATFSKYVSKGVVEEMLQDPDRVRLGGESRELTVLFSDIRGFTSISERMGPEDLVQVLNQFFTPMTRLVLDHGGTLDKYMGDALMAIFGAPVRHEDHASRACRAALAMRETLPGLNEGWRRAGVLPEGGAVDVGIGLNTGTMAVGNMGSEEVFDYTVIGDAVNLGSRIEGLNKPYRTQILVSEVTAQAANAAGDAFLFRELDRVQVKGKDEAVGLYELLAEMPAPAEAVESARRYDEALALFRGMRFAEAAEAFAALEADEGGGPAGVLAERCRGLAAGPVPEGWTAVERLTSK